MLWKNLPVRKSSNQTVIESFYYSRSRMWATARVQAKIWVYFYQNILEQNLLII